MSFYATEARTDGNGKIALAVIVSVLLHLLAITVYEFSLKNAQLPEISSDIISVELIPPPVAPSIKEKKQIVETASNQQIPKEVPAFEAEKDNYTEKQQILRGEEAQSSPQGNNQQAPAPKIDNVQKTESKPEAQKNLNKTQPKQLQLKLDSMDLSDLAESKKDDKPEDRAEKNIQQALTNQNRAPLGAGANVSRLGSRDYLPDIPDGEVSLLNAKANKYAVFVRRVASQVFANLKASGWQSISAGDINSIEKEARFEAVLNKQGQLLSVRKLAQSGSGKFDNVLESSIKKGAKDPNPPAGAEADDGLIHFVFEAKSWIQSRNSPRTGLPSQVRWLMLGTGLD